MRSRNELLPGRATVVHRLAAALVLGLACGTAPANAQGLVAPVYNSTNHSSTNSSSTAYTSSNDSAAVGSVSGITEPSWRQGISQWNGSSYGSGPVVASSTNLPPPVRPSEASTPVVAAPARLDPPYTIPSDPNQQVTRGEIRLTENHLLLQPPQTLPAPADSGIFPRPAVLPLAEPIAIDRMQMDRMSMEALPPESLSLESLTEQINADLGVEEPPLESEVVRWYEYPRRWIQGWNSHAELGINGSSGNANTFLVQTGLETKRKTDLYTIALDLDYRQASNRGRTTEDNGRFNLDYDRMLGQSSWSGFAKYGMEWDKFKAFDLRIWSNAGIGYHWIRRDDTTLITRFGAGASKEIGAPMDDWIPEAIFGIEGERQLNSRNKVKGKLEYFPAWEDFSDFRVVADVAWEVLLSDSDNLSLKLAATDRYDSTPQGAKKNDLFYSLLLLYKF